MLRTLFAVLLVIFGYRYLKNLFSSSVKESRVKGNNAHAPLDLKEQDVQEARFEDLNEDDAS